MNVYCLYFPNGKRYVGVETRTGTRITFHRRGHGLKLKVVPLVARAIQKHGWANVQWRYLFTNCDNETAWSLEKSLIKQFQTQKRECGYNVASGGKCPFAGYKKTPKQIETLARLHRGKIVPQRVRDKISETLTGRKHSLVRKLAICAGRMRNPKRSSWNRGVLGSVKANRGTFGQGRVAPLKGRISLPAGPNGELRYFKPEQLQYG